MWGKRQHATKQGFQDVGEEKVFWGSQRNEQTSRSVGSAEVIVHLLDKKHKSDVGSRENADKKKPGLSGWLWSAEERNSGVFVYNRFVWQQSLGHRRCMHEFFTGQFKRISFPVAFHTSRNLDSLYFRLCYHMGKQKRVDCCITHHMNH